MNIVDIKSDVEQKLNEYGLSNRNITYASIIVEEILLLYECDLEKISIDINKNSKELYIKLEILGDNISPRNLEEANSIYLLDNTLNQTNFILKHIFADNKNIIILSLERYFSILNNMKFGISYLKNSKKELFISLIFNVIAIIANVFVPLYTGKIIVSYTDNVFSQIIIMASLLLACRIVYIIFYSLANIYYNKITYHLFGSLQTNMLEKLFLVTDEKLEVYGAGHFIQRINSDSMTIAASIPTFFNIISNALYYAGIFVATLAYDKTVFVLELVIFIILFFLETKRTKRLDNNKRKVYQCEEEHSRKIFEQVSGAAEIKIMGAKRFFINSTSASAAKVAQLSTKTNTENAILTAINNTCSNLFCFIVLIYLGYALYIGKIQVSDALVLFNYFNLISMPLIDLIQRYMDFEKNFAISCERANSLLEGNEFTKEINGDLIVDNINGDIEFKNVSFSYNNSQSRKNRKVIDNISFKINAREVVGIVGKSGTGKSTILKLILGQRNPDIGLITIDGQDIMTIDKDSLRNSISIVNQMPFLFNTTIRDNLLLAKPDATQYELDDVCKKACIYKDIMETENGYDTILNENGTRFSGGQKQRLAIARALLRKPKILLLDESTSAIDNVSQHSIMSTIKNLDNECTVVIVAHRLSTIVDCDNIIVLDNGKILSQGKHNELIKNSSLYKELFLSENK